MEKMSKDEIKKHLIYSISEKVDSSNINEKVDKVEKYEDTVAIIK